MSVEVLIFRAPSTNVETREFERRASCGEQCNPYVRLAAGFSVVPFRLCIRCSCALAQELTLALNRAQL